MLSNTNLITGHEPKLKVLAMSVHVTLDQKELDGYDGDKHVDEYHGLDDHEPKEKPRS